MSITRRRFLSTSALAAAGGLASARGLSAAPRAAAQSGTLTVWGFEGTLEGMQSQVQAFNQKYPDVMVNVQTFDYETVHTNLLNAIVAGTGAPDLCAIDVVRLTQYIDGLVDLSSYRAANPRSRLLPGQALRAVDRFRAGRCTLPERHLGPIRHRGRGYRDLGRSGRGRQQAQPGQRR